jgi:hypothetical protein
MKRLPDKFYLYTNTLLVVLDIGFGLWVILTPPVGPHQDGHVLMVFYTSGMMTLSVL